MKYSIAVISIITLASLLLIFPSCQKPEKTSEAWFLTGADSANIAEEVSTAIDSWLDAYVKMDQDKAAQFWDSSPVMMYAENAEKYANWDSIRSAIRGIYANPVESMKFNFQPRDILPLSHNTADVFMALNARIKFKSGQLFQAKGYMTVLLVKKSGAWKILRGHESWKPIQNK